MTKIFLSIYYSTLTFIVIQRSAYLLGRTPPTDLVMFARPLKPLLVFDFLIPLICLLAIASLLTAIFIYSRIHRAIACLLTLVFFSVDFSYGKVSHLHHIWIISSVVFILLNSDKLLSDRSNIWKVRLIQSLALCPYLFSGLWKLRVANFENISSGIKDQLAYSIAEGAGPPLSSFFISNFNFLILGFIAVIIFQISAIYPIFTFKHQNIWAILAVWFHISTGIALGIWFTSTILGLFVILIILNKLINYENKVKYCDPVIEIKLD